MPGRQLLSTDTGTREAADAQPPWRRTLAVLGITAGCFSFQEMAVLPVLPIIQHKLAGAGTTSSALLESGFLIVAAVAAPLIGKLGDRNGKQRMLLVTLAVYLAGALGAGFAPNFMTLVAFRAVQGVGGALFSLSFAIMRDAAPRKLSVAIGWLVGAFGVGACLGLALSGVIAQLLSWRYIFFVEGALIVVSAVLVARLVPRSPTRDSLAVDYAGVALLGAALACLILSLTFVLTVRWPMAGGFVLAFALFIAWIWHERRSAEPLLAVQLLASRRVLLPILCSGLAGYVAFSCFFLVPRFVEVPQHLPPQVAAALHYGFDAGETVLGLYLLPVGVGLLCAGPTGGMLGRRFGGKWPFLAGLALLTVASVLLAVAHANRIEFAVWLFFVGAGFGFATGSAGVFITQAVSADNTGIANAFNSLARLVAGGIGAQVAAAILKSQSVAGTTAARASAFTVAFGVCALVALVGTGLLLLMPGGNAES